VREIFEWRKKSNKMLRKVKKKNLQPFFLIFQKVEKILNFFSKILFILFFNLGTNTLKITIFFFKNSKLFEQFLKLKFMHGSSLLQLENSSSDGIRGRPKMTLNKKGFEKWLF